MLSAIYVGLSGLDAYSRGLQAISNNITNLNSQGFRASSVSFSNVAGAGFSNGNGESYGSGGSHGVNMADPRTDMSAGELRQTDRDLDLAIDGGGFLMLMRGDEVAYTRTGSFEVDKDGYVVLSGTDYRLATLDGSGRPVSVSIDSKRTSAPQATTKITFSDNLSSSADTFSVSNLAVVDARGGEHVWTAKFAKDTTATDQFLMTVTDATGATIGTGTVHFINGVVDPATSTLAIADQASGTTVNFDLTAVTSYSAGSVSTLSASAADGYTSGTIATVTINEDGKLELGYSNAQKADLGGIAIAQFRDPQQLTQRSGGLFKDTGGAGRTLASSGDPRVGKVVSHRLEASNVDLSKEFGDLILIQRGFQASSQVISVTNDMIQQLFGIRGQG